MLDVSGYSDCDIDAVGWDREHSRRTVFGGLKHLECIIHGHSRTRRSTDVEVPTDEHTLAGVACIDSVCHRPVEIRVVFGRFGSETLNVEIGISCDQWIEGPPDRPDAALDAPVSLMMLEGAADSLACVSR